MTKRYNPGDLISYFDTCCIILNLINERCYDNNGEAEYAEYNVVQVLPYEYKQLRIRSITFRHGYAKILGNHLLQSLEEKLCKDS